MKLDTSSYYPKSPLTARNIHPAPPAANRLRPDSRQCRRQSLYQDRSRHRSLLLSRLEPAPTGASTDHGRVQYGNVVDHGAVAHAGLRYAARFGLSILNYVPAGTKLGFTLVVAALNILVPLY